MNHHQLRTSAVALFALAVVSSHAVVRAAEPLTETAKIEQLISHIREMKDAQFIRNGKAYDGAAAADHIQAKWSKVKDEIKTARDFIEKCASKSEASGEPYKIRLKDGSEKTAAEYLNAQLDQIEAKSPHG